MSDISTLTVTLITRPLYVRIIRFPLVGWRMFSLLRRRYGHDILTSLYAAWIMAGVTIKKDRRR